MTRRIVLALLAPWARLLAETRAAVRGRLLAGEPPRLRDEDGREWRLEADEESLAVLRDDRVRSEIFEARGVVLPPDGLRIDPIHKRAMFVVRGGKPLVITYWCDVCAIRTYSPGKCQCCQDETALDPRDPALDP